MVSPGILEKNINASCHVTSVDIASFEATPLETVLVALSFGKSEILPFFFLAFRFFFLFSIFCG